MLKVRGLRCFQLFGLHCQMKHRMHGVATQPVKQPIFGKKQCSAPDPEHTITNNHKGATSSL